MADYQPPTAASTGRYSLRRDSWREFDPFYPHYTRWVGWWGWGLVLCWRWCQRQVVTLPGEGGRRMRCAVSACPAA